MTAFPGISHPLRRRSWRTIALLAPCLAAGFVWFWIAGRPLVFIGKWSREFRNVTTLEDARRLEKGGRVWVKAFSNGEWLLATCEHSCCSGAGFDATVIRDSTGAILVDRTHTSCGVQGMILELEAVPGDSLSAFYAGAGHLRLERE